jgi:hypothetical protein
MGELLDDLARSLASETSRRQALRRIAGTISTAIFAGRVQPLSAANGVCDGATFAGHPSVCQDTGATVCCPDGSDCCVASDPNPGPSQGLPLCCPPTKSCNQGAATCDTGTSGNIGDADPCAAQPGTHLSRCQDSGTMECCPNGAHCCAASSPFLGGTPVCCSCDEGCDVVNCIIKFGKGKKGKERAKKQRKRNKQLRPGEC